MLLVKLIHHPRMKWYWWGFADSCSSLVIKAGVCANIKTYQPFHLWPQTRQLHFYRMLFTMSIVSLRIWCSGQSMVRTNYQQDQEPASRPVTTLGLCPVSKRPSPKECCLPEKNCLSGPGIKVSFCTVWSDLEHGNWQPDWLDLHICTGSIRT